jgi:hypothetical protein
MGYIYLLHLSLIAISHFFTFRLGFSSLLLHLTTLEDKRGIKCPRLPSKGGSSSPSSVATPPPAPSESPPLPGSPPEVFSRHHRSPVFEQGGPSKRIPAWVFHRTRKMSSHDTSWDEDFARTLFGDLNHGLLRPPDYGSVIIISDSDEEEETREEDAIDADVVPLLL